MIRLDFEGVEKLRQRLQKEYPILEKLHQPESIRHGSVKIHRSFDAPVRPTLSSNEVSSIVKNSSKFRKISDVEFPHSPRSLNKPILIKSQEYEVITNLDCFLKHISTKSYQKYIHEHVPGFKKSSVKIVKFPDVAKKSVRKNNEVCLDESNLKLLGQKEANGTVQTVTKGNLLKINRKINREVRKWCINESKNPDPEAQIIDHHTFKSKI